eukprot:scaffold20311_cov42-Prasinocladus_malaysianus.AAC.2
MQSEIEEFNGLIDFLTSPKQKSDDSGLLDPKARVTHAFSPQNALISCVKALILSKHNWLAVSPACTNFSSSVEVLDSRHVSAESRRCPTRPWSRGKPSVKRTVMAGCHATVNLLQRPDIHLLCA